MFWIFFHPGRTAAASIFLLLDLLTDLLTDCLTDLLSDLLLVRSERLERSVLAFARETAGGTVEVRVTGGDWTF